MCDGLRIDEETASKVSWQNFVDDLQRTAVDAETKGKRFLVMDHPYQLMSSSLVNSLIDVPGRPTRPTPIVVDHKFDGSVTSSGPEREDDLSAHSNPTLIPD
ncbi:hypothetical protein PQX77_002857, partial [Marasmius sp. AFHP31]